MYNVLISWHWLKAKNGNVLSLAFFEAWYWHGGGAAWGVDTMLSAMVASKHNKFMRAS